MLLQLYIYMLYYIIYIIEILYIDIDIIERIILRTSEYTTQKYAQEN